MSAVAVVLWMLTVCGGIYWHLSESMPVVANVQLQGDRGEERQQMVEQQLRARGIADQAVLNAIGSVQRHRFVPEELSSNAYEDRPLPIGFDQTISQPYIVAYMTEALGLSSEARVLEIGSGSGYQTAVLAELVREVYSIEIVPELAARSRDLLSELGYENVDIREGDGYAGWPEKAPFDAIIVTASPDHVPQPLIEQIAVGGRLVIPVGRVIQNMMILTRTPNQLVEEITLPVRFVPMTGEALNRNR